MANGEGTLARVVRRGAMVGSIFVAGAITGYVVARLDLLPAPPGRATTAAAPVRDSLVGAEGADSARAPTADTLAPPSAAPTGAMGLVRVGPPVRDSASGTATPVPTRDELATLRAALVVPVAGVARADLPDTFDERRGAGGARPHHALDIMAPRGTPVLSAADGRLLALFTSADGGLMVYAADPSERFVLLYAHLDRYADGLTEGMPLRRGQPLGTVGSSGNASPESPHLHFGILRTDDVARWSRGTPVDPHALLAP